MGPLICYEQKNIKKKKNQDQCRDYIENVKLIWALYFYGVIIIIIIILGCVIVLVSKVGCFLFFSMSKGTIYLNNIQKIFLGKEPLASPLVSGNK